MPENLNFARKKAPNAQIYNMEWTFMKTKKEKINLQESTMFHPGNCNSAEGETGENKLVILIFIIILYATGGQTKLTLKFRVKQPTKI